MSVGGEFPVFEVEIAVFGGLISSSLPRRRISTPTSATFWHQHHATAASKPHKLTCLHQSFPQLAIEKTVGRKSSQ
jgi:hypothetical protein